MGAQEKQTKDELREDVSSHAILLRQEHHPENRWEALRVQIRLRSSRPSRIQLLRNPSHGV